jgi:hypothetical protein
MSMEIRDSCGSPGATFERTFHEVEFIQTVSNFVKSTAIRGATNPGAGDQIDLFLMCLTVYEEFGFSLEQSTARTSSPTLVDAT